MEFLNCLWLDAERGIEKKHKNGQKKVIFQTFLKNFNTPGGSFSVIISNVFGAGRYYLVV